MIALLTSLVLGYSVFIVAAIIGWLRLPSPELPESYKPQIKISVLIAVRNEAENIGLLLQDLAAQNYPKDLLEVLIIDDHSKDRTAEIVKHFIAGTDLSLRLLRLENGRGKGKKSAIAFGLEQANGELIVQTDGDCRLQPDWLKLLEYVYVSEGAKFISGPVCLTAQNSLFQKMQVVEFASLIGSGAASMGLGKPNMCNGANLAYEKAAFYAVNGFAGNEKIPSGDDEFLMHKIQAAFPGKVKFLKAKGGTVFTAACETLPQFLAQRIRWASKWKHYKNPAAQLLALLVFGVNLILPVALIFWLTGYLAGNIFWPAFLLKTTVDFVFLGLVLQFLGRTEYFIYIFPLQLVYMPYVVLTALAGLAGTYRWKGRTLKNNDGNGS
ncbi:glycosyltransferase family 2 protein [Adhaeribacter terreus]|uniref:Glycosyltransferase n=1 Tax=Adhaeribacter terreus TaxID=529703 RepID=A0ABW0E9J3_9BACT